jgi:hypothetical protein
MTRPKSFAWPANCAYSPSNFGMSRWRGQSGSGRIAYGEALAAQHGRKLALQHCSPRHLRRCIAGSPCSQCPAHSVAQISTTHRYPHNHVVSGGEVSSDIAKRRRASAARGLGALMQRRCYPHLQPMVPDHRFCWYHRRVGEARSCGPLPEHPTPSPGRSSGCSCPGRRA